MKRIRKRKGPVLHHPSRPTPEQIRQRIAAVRPDVLRVECGRYSTDHLEAVARECKTFAEFKQRKKPNELAQVERLREVWQLVKGKV